MYGMVFVTVYVHKFLEHSSHWPWDQGKRESDTGWRESISSAAQRYDLGQGVWAFLDFLRGEVGMIY